MKAIKIVSVLFVLILWTACVPSLHGIVLEGEELIDDDIINQWVSNKTYGNMQITIKMDDEEGEEKEFSSFEDLAAYMKDGKMPESGTSWLIERAGSITFEKYEDEDNNASISLDIATASMAPDGYKISKFDSLPYYMLKHVDWDSQDTIISYLTIKLTEIGGKRYMDFVPFPKGIDFWEGRFATNLIAAHTFARYEVSEEGLLIQPIDGEHIEDLIEKKRIRLKHENVDGSTILTASTAELRAFLEKYQEDEDLFDDEEVLTALK